MSRTTVFLLMLLIASVAAGYQFGVGAGIALYVGILLLKSDVIIKIAGHH